MLRNRPKVLLVDDEQDFREVFVVAFGDHYELRFADKEEHIFHYLNSGERFDLMLLDLELEKGSDDLIGLRLIGPILKKRPNLPIVVVTKDKRSITIKLAQDAGASGFLLKTDYNEASWIATFDKSIQAGVLARIQDKLQRLSQLGKTRSFIGESPKIQDIKKTLDAVSKIPNTPVLILGETGTGKEVAAHYLHHLSPRKNKPLVAVNLSAIQESLLESTLFGAVKGAFTGSIRDTEGYFRQANGGILMLDEIGDINHDIQIKLLRFFEDRKIRPVGSDSDMQLDVQIIAATHQDLADRVKKGTFRGDLYQRLKAMTVVLPPLRTREDDMELLLQHYFGDPFSVKENFTPQVWQRLLVYDWPGNIRELRNAIDYMLLRQLIQEKHLIDEECLPEDIVFLKETSKEEHVQVEAMSLEKEQVINMVPVFNGSLPRLEALALLNLHYIEQAMLLKNKVKHDVAEVLGFKSADSLLYEIRTCSKDYPHLFAGDAFPYIKAAYPQFFNKISKH